MTVVAILTIASSIISLLSLLALHFTSPEFQPSWRMISEYALGKYKGVLTIFFFAWGLGSILCALLLWNNISGIWATLGVMMVLVTGIGAIAGGLFDVKHKLHGLAFGLGVPFLPIGALLIAYHLIQKVNWLNYKQALLVSSHAIWISLLLMAISMMLIFSGFKKAGYPMGPDVEPPKELPKGVIGINGYMNRLLVLCYILWNITIAFIFLKIN
jgi:hypothetical protein